MPETTSSELAKELFARLEEASRTSKEAIVQAGLPLVRLLMEGQPVSLDRLSARTDLAGERLNLLLDRLGAERDSEGRIVGLALSLTPTLHRYEAEGRLLYGWCAADTLILPGILEHTAAISSPDPVSGEIVRAVVSPRTIKQLNPSTARIAWIREGSVSDMRESFCRPGRFFAREETARQWACRREGTDVVPVGESFAAARVITERIRSWATSR